MTSFASSAPGPVDLPDPRRVLDQVLAWGASETVLMGGAAALVAGVVMAGVALATRPGQGAARSLAAIEGTRSSVRTARDLDLDRSVAERVLEPARMAAVNLGRRITPAGQIARTQRRIELAGHPPDWDVDRVVALQVLAAVLGAALAAIAGFVTGSGPLRGVALVVVAAVLGWLIPAFVVYRMAASRSERLMRDLPDTLDLLTISVEAGLGFDAAVSQVARRVRGPLAREFSRVLQEMQIGTGRAEALRALGERTDVADIKSFASAVNQADVFGVPLARALRVQADDMRVKRRLRAEEKAQQVPVKILFPLLLGILPVLFIAIIGPAAITTVRNLGGLGG